MSCAASFSGSGTPWHLGGEASHDRIGFMNTEPIVIVVAILGVGLAL